MNDEEIQKIVEENSKNFKLLRGNGSVEQNPNHAKVRMWIRSFKMYDA